MRIFPFFLPFILFALPTNPQISMGEAAFHTIENELQIHASDQCLIEWDSFSIDLFEKVSFDQPDYQSAVLNRVIGADPSKILGELSSNGNLLLINPQGIWVGKEGNIQAHSFYASTWDLPNDFFQRGKYCFTEKSNAPIVFQGLIEVEEDVYLISRTIRSDGTIYAKRECHFFPRVIIACAENEIDQTQSFANLLPQNEDALLFLQEGERFVLRNEAIEIDGGIIAKEIHVEGKEIALLENTRLTSYEGNVNLHSEIFTYIDPESIISNIGGEVSFLSNQSTFFYGTVLTGGGKEAGRVEVSGKDIDFRGNVWTKSLEGINGTLLLDPTDITVGNADTTPPSFAYPPSQSLFTRPGPTAILNVAELVSQLNNGNNVTINTASGGVAPNGGRITIEDAIRWNDFTLLEFVADENILIQSKIVDKMGGGIRFTATQDVILQPNGSNVIVSSLGGTIDVNAVSLQLVATTNLVEFGSSRSGTININTTGDVVISGGTVNGASAVLEGAQRSFLNGTIGGNLTLTGGTALNTRAEINTNRAGRNVSFEVEGNISLTAGSESGSHAKILALDNLLMDIGGSLTLTSSSEDSAEIRSRGGTVDLLIGTVIASDLALTGDSMGGKAKIFGAGTTNVTVSGDVTMVRSSILSDTSSLTVQGTNFNLSDISVITAAQDTNVSGTAFILDRSEVTSELSLVSVTANTVDLDRSSIQGAGCAFLNIPALNLFRSEIVSIGDPLNLTFGDVTFQNESKISSTGENITMNVNSLIFQNESSIETRNEANVTSATILRLLNSSFIESTSTLTLNGSNVTCNNSRIESTGGTVSIQASNNLNINNSGRILSCQDMQFTVGNNFNLLSDGFVGITSGSFSIGVNNNFTMQNSRMETTSLTVTTIDASLDNATIESIIGGVDFTLAGNMNLSNNASINTLNLLSTNGINLDLNQSSLISQQRQVQFTGTLAQLQNTASIVAPGIRITSTTDLNMTDSSMTGDEINLQLTNGLIMQNSSIIGDSLVDIEAVSYNL